MQLSVSDVAQLLNVSEKTVYRWLQQGKLPAYRTFLTKYKVTVGGASTADAGTDARK